MTTKQFITKWLEYLEAWNKRDMDLADRLTDECISKDCLMHVPGWPGAEIGSAIETQKEFARDMVANNPDFHITIDEALSDGDKMILRGVMLMNNQTTGVVESNVILEIDKITDGKMVESWSMMIPGKW